MVRKGLSEAMIMIRSELASKSHGEGHSRQREQTVQRPRGRHVQEFKEETHVAGINGVQGGGEVREGLGLARTSAALIMTQPTGGLFPPRFIEI